MPSIYTHYRFGHDVLSALHRSTSPVAVELAALIERNRDIFTIGFQGPDILFHFRSLSHNPVNAIGHGMHDQLASDFFLRSKDQLDDISNRDSALAYLLGFICHFSLDSECHSYIEHRILNCGGEHLSIESAFDRHWLELDGRNLKKFNPASHLVNAALLNDVMGKLLGTTAQALHEAIFSMRATYLVLRPSGSVMDTLVRTALRFTGNAETLGGLLMSRPISPACLHSNKVLATRYEGAIPLAVSLMENFYLCCTQNETLSTRFVRTFGPFDEEMARYAGSD